MPNTKQHMAKIKKAVDNAKRAKPGPKPSATPAKMRGYRIPDQVYWAAEARAKSKGTTLAAAIAKFVGYYALDADIECNIPGQGAKFIN